MVFQRHGGLSASQPFVGCGEKRKRLWFAGNQEVRTIGVLPMAKNKPQPTGKQPSKTGAKKPVSGVVIVAENRKARHNYEILDEVECGMMLMGSEVKSIREGKLSLDEAYIRERVRSLWLIGADIAHYNNAGSWNHDSKRPRKLLVHSREYNKFAGRAHERGLTLIPLRVYFNERGIAKCVMALVKGKKIHDKREAIKKRESDRGLQRLNRRR
jgi:SsrA-binding protein